MAEKKNHIASSLHRSGRQNKPAKGFYTPFEDLDQHLVQLSGKEPLPDSGGKKKTAPESREPAGNKEPEDDERLFREAMSGVVPIPRVNGKQISFPAELKKYPRFLAREEAEVYARLVDLVTGEGHFELTYSDEYVDGAVVGLSPEILTKLRNGDFSYQEYLDLHGYNSQQARESVTRFVQEGFARKWRCLLIVSGRGLNSRDKEPVLKRQLVGWLTRSPLKRIVLAFASARAYDGGAGAFYVLLRSNEGKAPFVSPAM